MQTARRGIDAGVVERLLDRPFRFKFFQAMRVLETWFSQHDEPESDERRDQGIVFRNSLALTFPPSEIEHAISYDEAGDVLAGAEAVRTALAQSKIERIELTPAFFGLLGGQGALPLHYTEQLIARAQLQRDHAARAFFDVFSSRATTLFYAAWKKYRLPFHYELDREERYLPLLLALAGVPDAAMREHLQEGGGALIDEAIAGYASAARHRPMSAAFLETVLTDYFRVPVRVEEFAGKWYAIPQERLTVLGEINSTLGATALAGERVWQRDMRMRIVVGPLNKRDYEMFLPDESRAIALERMLTLLAGITTEYEVSLVLARNEVGMSRLGMGARLGYDAFLCTRSAERDRDDARYELNVIH